MQTSDLNSPGTCAICRNKIEATHIFRCPSCGQPYHSNCWAYNNNQCAVLGCTGHTNPNVNNGPRRTGFSQIGVVMVLITFIIAIIIFAGNIGSNSIQTSPQPVVVKPSMTSRPYIPATNTLRSSVVTIQPTKKPTLKPSKVPTKAPTKSSTVALTICLSETAPARKGPGTNFIITEWIQNGDCIRFDGRYPSMFNYAEDVWLRIQANQEGIYFLAHSWVRADKLSISLKDISSLPYIAP